MYNSYSAIEKRLQAACEAAKAQKKAKVAPLARQFDVPVSRLRARLNGRQSRTQHPITTKRLDDSQEAALIRWIERLDSLHVPPTASMVEASANAMIRRTAEAAREMVADSFLLLVVQQGHHKLRGVHDLLNRNFFIL
jgi:hypothetical protein